MIFNIKIFGIVQGVGFRPFIARLTAKFNILGTVANKGSYVEIFAQGSESKIKDFCDSIRKNAPPRSAILNIICDEIDISESFTDFKIVESEHEVGNIFVSPDIAICEQCENELFDKKKRRYLHPFINCTACGPRFTILQNMPYDRERTSMNKFPMCDNCKGEYYNQESRRYDAQPVCCNDCGPEVYILGGTERGSEAIKKIRSIIKNGGVVAIKGIGGFHIACDASNFETVKRLRQLKHRPQKPFAVMTKNFLVKFPKFINDYQKPIALLPKKLFNVAENVAPNNNKLGVMLPYTPLHLLIFNYPDEIKDFPNILVMTSGNISGSPIAINDDDAKNDLSNICDAILSHNRDILIRADDSVVDVIDDEPYMIRRSRGYAPLPIYFNTYHNIEVLAIGGELKNTFCLSKNNLFYLSPYIGDMTNLKSIEVLKNSIRRMIRLLEIEPKIIACDLHPRYHTTKIAEYFSKHFDVPLLKIQHHYAHILSCMAENNINETVIGVAFDGTGYGLDDTIWGGEFLIADLKSFKRFHSINSFIQAGGDKSSVEGWRNAISMIFNYTKNANDTKKIAIELNLIDEDKLNGQIFLLENNINCVKSTSAGRLFDAVSAILGLCNESTFEGEAAMKLQYAAENFSKQSSAISKNFFDIVKSRLSGEDVNQLAFEFHIGIANFIVNTCKRARMEMNISTVALTGGVFQNSLLLKLTTNELIQNNFKVIRHKLIPANDGGICLGQAISAITQYK